MTDRLAVLGRRSLRFDAAYCALAGVAMVGLRRPLGRTVGIPSEAVAGSGLATVAWSGALAALSRHADRRWPVAAVGVANAVAATALVTAGARQRHAVARLVLGLGGLQVAGFAVSQAAALLQPGRPDQPVVG